MTYFISVFSALFLIGVGVGFWNGAHFEIARLSGMMLGAVYNQVESDEDGQEDLTFHSAQFCILMVSITIIWVSGYEEDQYTDQDNS
jgi:hypothetical protein